MAALTIPSDYLVEFVAVVRAGSLVGAAAELGLSHSSLSRHMRDLETRLGFPLLRRLSNGVEPTERGREVYVRAADIANIVEDIAYYAQRAGSGPRAITLGGMLVVPALTGRIARACSSMPASAPGGPVQLRYHPYDSLDCGRFAEQLDAREVDLAIVQSTDLLDSMNDRFDIQGLARVRYVAVMEPGHPLASREALRLRDLAEQTIIHADSDYDRARSCWLEVRALLRGAGVDFRAVTANLTSDSDWMRTADRGIILLPEEYVVVTSLVSMGKVRVPVEDAFATFYAVCRRDDAAAIELGRRARLALS